MNGVPNMSYTFQVIHKNLFMYLPEEKFFNKLFKTDISIISKGEIFK